MDQMKLTPGLKVIDSTCTHTKWIFLQRLLPINLTNTIALFPVLMHFISISRINTSREAQNS